MAIYSLQARVLFRWQAAVLPLLAAVPLRGRMLTMSAAAWRLRLCGAAGWLHAGCRVAAPAPTAVLPPPSQALLSPRLCAQVLEETSAEAPLASLYSAVGLARCGLLNASTTQWHQQHTARGAALSHAPSLSPAPCLCTHCSAALVPGAASLSLPPPPTPLHQCLAVNLWSYGLVGVALPLHVLAWYEAAARERFWRRRSAGGGVSRPPALRSAHLFWASLGMCSTVLFVGASVLGPSLPQL